jgi:hypothetical protein
MNVRAANIIGMLFGLVFGSQFSPQIEWLIPIVGLITAFNLLVSKKQFLKGPFWGLIFGILLGYSLREYFIQNGQSLQPTFP